MKPGMMAPLTSGGGAVSGKLSAATVFFLRLAMDQIISLSTSRASYSVQNTSPPLSSARMKSNTPCAPGFLPVMIEHHAGGVSGLGVERSLARTPFSSTFFMNGMVMPSPGRSRTISLRTVKVQPSRPMNSVEVMKSPGMSRF